MKQIRLFFLQIAFVLITVACKKYPGGGYHMNAKKIFNSKSGVSFNVTRFEVNGIDSLDVVGGDANNRSAFVTFLKYGYDNYFQAKGVGAFECEFNGDELSIDQFAGKKSVLNPERHSMTWKIVKCKGGELIFEGSSSQNQYLLVLNKH